MSAKKILAHTAHVNSAKGSVDIGSLYSTSATSHLEAKAGNIVMGSLHGNATLKAGEQSHWLCDRSR